MIVIQVHQPSLYFGDGGNVYEHCSLHSLGGYHYYPLVIVGSPVSVWGSR
jgi:hypothetical protein